MKYIINKTNNVLNTVIDTVSTLDIDKAWQVEITEYKSTRRDEQNRLQWVWCQEISRQKEDESPDEIQAYNKLHYGVPIMRENEKFRITYDKIIKPLPYENKLELMRGDFMPVTRLMNTEQFTRYLDAVLLNWMKQGYTLTIQE